MLAAKKVNKKPVWLTPRHHRCKNEILAFNSDRKESLLSKFTKTHLNGDLSAFPYVISEPLWWERHAIGSDEMIIVPKGFTTDLASIPWFLQWFIPLSGRHNLAAVLHDYLYRQLRGSSTKYARIIIHDSHGLETGDWIFNKRNADNEFLQALLTSEVKQTRAMWIYYAVRFFGVFAIKKKKSH